MKEADKKNRRNLIIAGVLVGGFAGGAAGLIGLFLVMGMSDGGFGAFMVALMLVVPAAGLGAVLGGFLGGLHRWSVIAIKQLYHLHPKQEKTGEMR